MKVDEEGQRLSGLDQELGRKQADLHILSSDLESNQKEMVSALQDAESTLTAIKQKVKVCHGQKKVITIKFTLACQGRLVKADWSSSLAQVLVFLVR